ncbi:MAG: Zn-ribbon domain-containing OB-fold protein [Chloroflexi bacterium]|nr:Zn-ribbon domain-containing OB-fold protein [Chloroflexota bacterium]
MPTPAHWESQRCRTGLVGEVCKECGARLFPPRDICPHCAEPAQTVFRFRGNGEVYSYSVVHYAPAGYETYAPYPVALVKLEEGPLITAQLTDVDSADVRIGMPVEMVTRKIREEGQSGVIVYGYKFRPRLDTLDKESHSEPARHLA